MHLMHIAPAVLHNSPYRKADSAFERCKHVLGTDLLGCAHVECM